MQTGIDMIVAAGSGARDHVLPVRSVPCPLGLLGIRIVDAVADVGDFFSGYCGKVPTGRATLRPGSPSP